MNNNSNNNSNSNSTSTPIRTRRSIVIDLDNNSNNNSNSNNTDRSMNTDSNNNNDSNNQMDTSTTTVTNKRKRSAPKKLTTNEISNKSFFHSNEEEQQQQQEQQESIPAKPTPSKRKGTKKAKVEVVTIIDSDNPPKLNKLILSKKTLTGILSNISNKDGTSTDTSITSTTTSPDMSTTTTTTTTTTTNTSIKLLVGSLTINSEYFQNDKVYLYHYNDNTSNGFFTDLASKRLAEFTIDCPASVFKSIVNLYSKNVIDLKFIKNQDNNNNNIGNNNSNNIPIVLQVYLINESFIEKPNATITTNRNNLFTAFKIVLNYFLNTGGVGREFDIQQRERNSLDIDHDTHVDEEREEGQEQEEENNNNNDQINNSLDLEKENNDNGNDNDKENESMNVANDNDNSIIEDKENNNSNNEKKSINDISIDIFVDKQQQEEEQEIKPFNANELYEKVKMKGFQEISKEKISSNIISKLKRYQLRTVNWMLNRELNPSIKLQDTSSGSEEKIHPLWSKFNLDGVEFYYNEYTGVLTKDPVVYKDEDFHLHGGILADEPGVGKTVEFLGLLVANQRETKEPKILRHPLPVVQREEREVKENVPVKEYVDSDGGVVACCCGRDVDAHGFGIWAQCDSCQRWQFVGCVGSRYKASAQLYFCTFCTTVKRVKPEKVDEKDRWDTQTLVQSRATLIVSPASISGQWVEEVKKHTKDLKVFEYQGIFKTPITPYDLADYDIVLTTYDALSLDASYMDQTSAGTVLRYVTIDPPKTPLKCVQWWRVCLDEAQMVEHSSSNYKKLINLVPTVHRWCLTGTPIQKGLDDLYGLIQFLDIQPYTDKFWWTKAIVEKYLAGDVKTRNHFHLILESIMLRNAKIDIMDELSLPVQHDKDTKLLRFSMVESHYYTQKAQECALESRKLFQKYFARSSISSLDISKILHPLLVLRQICQHPQIGTKGARSLEKNTMTMDQLLDRLIEKSSIESKFAQRSVVHALNCLAAAELIKNNHDQAITLYRDALELIEQNRIHFKADWFQELHIFFNLNDIVSMNRYTLKTPRDETYFQEYEKLKSSYMFSKNQQMLSNLETFNETTSKVKESITNSTEWWNKGLKLTKQLESGKAKKDINNNNNNSSDSESDDLKQSQQYYEKPVENLLSKIERDLYVLDKTQRKESISKDIKSINDVQTILNKHHNAIINCRNEFLNTLLPLTTSFSDKDIQLSLNCSNCRNRSNKSTSVCQHCICMEQLQLLRDKLYLPQRKSSRNNNNNNNNNNSNTSSIINSNNTMFNYENNLLGDETNKFIEDLVKEGSTNSLANSEIEKVLRTLYGHIKSFDKELAKQAEDYLNLLKILKQELREASQLWSSSKNYLNSFDEVESAIIRIRLRYPGEILEPHEQLFKLNPIEVNPFVDRFEIEKKKSMESFKNTIGQLSYLKSLKDKKIDEKEMKNQVCIICQEVMDTDVVLLLCGHSFCYECIKFMIDKNPLAETILCPCCRTRLNISEISYISKTNEQQQDDQSTSSTDTTTTAVTEFNLKLDPSIEIKGSFGTKIEAILYTLIKIQRESVELNGTVDKVIIFSQWSDVLKVISMALKENNIGFARTDQSGAQGFQSAINSFRKNSHINVLLLLTAKGANGLNLIEATHIFIVEPLLNPAVEAQAINRVHRFGQEKQTFIHRFIIKNTIEEKVVQMNKRKEKELLGWKLPSKKDNDILSKDDIEFLLDN